MSLLNLNLDKNLKENVTYDTHIIPLSICIDEFDDYKDMTWHKHWHEEFEFGVLVAGKLRYSVYGDKQEEMLLKPGDGIFINSSVLHSAVALEKGTVLDCFILPKTLFKLKSFDSFGVQALSPILNSDIKFLDLKQNIPENNGIINCIRELCSISDSGIEYELHGLELTLKIWRYLIDRFRDTQITNSFPENYNQAKRVKLMIQFIYENYNKNISVEDLANSANISRTECFRAFKEVLSKTPNQYLSDYRLSMATMFLSDTDQTLANISEICGFQNPSYFGRRFKSFYGMTPKEYRVQMRDE